MCEKSSSIVLLRTCCSMALPNPYLPYWQYWYIAVESIMVIEWCCITLDIEWKHALAAVQPILLPPHNTCFYFTLAIGVSWIPLRLPLFLHILTSTRNSTSTHPPLDFEWFSACLAMLGRWFGGVWMLLWSFGSVWRCLEGCLVAVNEISLDKSEL